MCLYFCSYFQFYDNCINCPSKWYHFSFSRKLLLLRKRDTVYTRSNHGFSLRKYKVLSVGGSSLKWSKSIENRSKKVNEVRLTHNSRSSYIFLKCVTFLSRVMVDCKWNFLCTCWTISFSLYIIGSYIGGCCSWEEETRKWRWIICFWGKDQNSHLQ